MKTEINPRYLHYCKAHGKTLEEMKEFDAVRWPGGCMCGFILWIQSGVTAFRKSSPHSFVGHRIADQSAFTTFLSSFAHQIN